MTTLGFNSFAFSRPRQKVKVDVDDNKTT